jgi:hypothetical protein
MNRSHSQIVTGLAVVDRGDDLMVQLKTSGDAELEMWAAARHVAPLEHALGKPIRLETVAQPSTAPVTATPRPRELERFTPETGLVERAERGTNAEPGLHPHRGLELVRTQAARSQSTSVSPRRQTRSKPDTTVRSPAPRS